MTSEQKEPSDAEKLIADLRQEVEEYDALIVLQNQRQKESGADALWRKAHNQPDNIYPDTGDLIAWLVAERAKFEKAYMALLIDALPQAIEDETKRLAALQRAKDDAREQAQNEIFNHCVVTYIREKTIVTHALYRDRRIEIKELLRAQKGNP
jgi:hypothetical protein